MKKRIIGCVLLAALLIGGSITGTVAWLQTESNTVVNTFTYGDINIKLDETKMDANGEPVLNENGDPVRAPEGNIYKMVPGDTIFKDPVVTVLDGNEACYLFVKLEESGGVSPYGFGNYLSYELAVGWNQLTDSAGNAVSGVYYREVEEDTNNQPAYYPVLKDNAVKVSMDVTKEMLNELDEAGTENYPKLSITAYAVQLANIESAAQAWEYATAEPEASE